MKGRGDSGGMLERGRDIARSVFDAGLRPLAGLCIRAGVTPNQVTWAGFAVNAGAAACIVSGRIVEGGLIYLFAGAFDMLDGTLARLSGRASPFGALLDSSLDRLSEGVVLAALAYHFAEAGAPGYAALVVLGLLASVMVSYVRARAEGLGGECKVGFMTRPERVVLLGLGLAVDQAGPAVVLLVAMSAVTAIQRLAHVARWMAIRQADEAALGARARDRKGQG